MEISVLGPLAVRRDGVEIQLGPRLRRVFATLVSDHDRVVSIDRIVDAVWMGEPADGAEKSLKTYMTRLRQAIDPDRDGLITFDAPGYVLRLNGYSLDSECFDAEVDEATLRHRTADDEHAIRLLTTALDRWRGDAYAGFADEDWARPEAVRLEERRLEAMELLVEARLGVGDVDPAIAGAQSLIESQPLRERPRELLMRALYVSGRQADALRVFRSFRHVLVEETGLDPSEELVELEGRIAQGDQSLSGSLRAVRGFELCERIGQGTFSVVHRAVQPGIRRDVAVKIIRSELADRPEFVRRFEHEAQTVASVEHPHVVPLYDYWREPGAAFLVMRLLRGGSVEDALRARGPLSPQATAELLRDVGSALEAAHRKGVVHRDIRPANLLLDDQGSVYLADFGIAMPATTPDGSFIAWPAHASPELLRGEPTDVTTDVFGVGITTFELLTGRLPFADSADRTELIRRQLTEPLPPARAIRAELPAGIDDVLARATANATDDRYATVGALVDDLVAVLDASDTRHRIAELHGSAAPAENPYVGLHAFDEADADRFYGREALVTELVEMLESQPFVVVVGPSGSGKSSVVRAGLVPAVRGGAIPGSDRWLVTTMVPGADPIDALQSAVVRVAVGPQASLRGRLHEPGGLLRAIRGVLPDDDTRLLIVVDQLEELFTMTDDEEQARFLAELALAITAPGSPVRVVATLRADHYDVPLRHPAFADLATDGAVTIRPMTPGELQRVIELPVRSVGVDVEPALIADLVAAVSERPSALPLLQFALTEAFERRVSDQMLASVHHDLGGLTGAVAARADRIVDAGGPVDEQATRLIFGRLVTFQESGNSRRRAARSEFGDDERTARLLDAFASARLLTLDRDDVSREPTVEVAHEALLRDWPRLRDWIAEDRDDLRIMRGIGTATEAWIASGRDDGELARRGRLATCRELFERRPELFNERESDWVSASAVAADAEVLAQQEAAARDRRQNRRLRQLLMVSAALVVFAVIAAATAIVLRNRAVDARETAEIERLAALSSDQASTAPDVAILLALEANRRRDDPVTQGALHRALATQASIVSTIPDPLDGASVTQFSRDGRVALARTTSIQSGQVVWFDPASGEELGSTDLSDVGIIESAISGDGSVTALALADGTIRFVDVNGQEVASPFRSMRGSLLGLSLDGPGTYLLVVSEIWVDLVDVATGDIVCNQVGEVCFGSDDDSRRNDVARAAAALSEDGTFSVVEFVERQPNPGSPESQVLTGYDILESPTTKLPGARVQRVFAGDVTSLALSTGRLVVGYEDGTVDVSDVRGDTPATQLSGPTGAVLAVGVAPDGTIAAAEDGLLHLWSADGVPLSAPVPLAGSAVEIAFGPDGDAVVALDDAEVVTAAIDASLIVDKSYEIDRSFNVFSDHPYFETLSSDFATAQFRRLSDGEIEAETSMSELYPRTEGERPFYSSDGEWLLTVGPVLQNGVVVTELGGDRSHRVDVGSAYLEALGAPLPGLIDYRARPGIGGDQVFVAIRDLAGGRTHAFWVNTATSNVAAGPIELDSIGRPLELADGRVIISGDQSTVKILPVGLDGPPIVVAGTEGFAVLDQDENSGLVLAGGPNGEVGVIDVDEATVRSLDTARGALRAGTFSPDGTRVAVIAADGSIQLLDVRTGILIGAPMRLDRQQVESAGIHWDDDGPGVWVATTSGPVRFGTKLARWREIACRIVNRELTAEEWQTFVSATSPPVPACS